LAEHDLIAAGAEGRTKSAIPAIPIKLASLAIFLAAWEIIGRIIGSRLLPPASDVIAAMWRETVDGPLALNLATTLLRVAAAFLVAMILGTLVGLAMGGSRRLDTIFDSWLTILLNLPALVLIVLIYIWFGLTEFSIVLAVALNKLPTTAVIVREGARTIYRELMDMAASFRLGRWTTLRHVFLPQLYPYLIAASRSGLALIWKIVLVAEILGRSTGIGFQIQVYFQLFDVTRILAYSLAFIIVVQLIEWGALQPLERRTARGRK
jgi:NitT/TauT family transport system permease protein